MPAPDIQKQVENAVRRLNTLYTRTLPVKVGTKAVSLTKKRFSDSAFNGRAWQEPYRRKLSFKGAQASYKTLLSGTNHLRDVTYFKPEPGKVYIRNQVDYAQIHNEGGSIKVTAKMKRYFWYRYSAAKGARLTKKRGGLRKTKGNEALTREAMFWRNMALKREGSLIRMPRRHFFGPDANMSKEIRKIIERELQLFVKNYGTYFRESR
jgi:hypothetical protein